MNTVNTHFFFLILFLHFILTQAVSTPHPIHTSNIFLNPNNRISITSTTPVNLKLQNNTSSYSSRLHQFSTWIKSLTSAWFPSPISRWFSTIVNKDKSNYINNNTNKKLNSTASILNSVPSQHSPSFHNAYIAGTHITYKLPHDKQNILGLTLLFHACQQNSTDWSQLPEHRKIVSQLMQNNLAIIAFTSRDRITGCWSTRFPASQNLDAAAVIKATNIARSVLSLPHDIPMYAIGISSGATFLTVLAASHQIPQIRSQALYISPGNVRALRNATSHFPSTLFVHISSDKYYATSNMIAHAQHILSRRHVHAVSQLSLTNIPFSPQTFHDRDPRISLHHSNQLYKASRQYRGKAMEFAIRASTNEAADQLRQDVQLQRAVRQVTRLVSGSHEVSAMHVDLVVKWMIKNGFKNRR